MLILRVEFIRRKIHLKLLLNLGDIQEHPIEKFSRKNNRKIFNGVFAEKCKFS